MAGGGDGGPLTNPVADDRTAWPAVIITDISGLVSYWNPAAEELYGWSSRETVGRSILDINVGASDQDHAAEIMARLATGSTWEGRFPLRRRDGTTFVGWVADAPLLDLDGKVVGVIGLSVPSLTSDYLTSDDLAAPPGRRGNPSHLIRHRYRQPAGRKLGVAVYGEAHQKLALEAFIRANPGRLELVERSPAVVLVAAGDRPPYDLAQVGALTSGTGATTPAVVAIATRPSDEVALQCIRRKFRGYLRADLNDAEMLNAIEQAAAGHVVIDGSLSRETGRRAALTELAHPHLVNRWDLRPREMETLTYLTSGLSNRDIARRMVVGEETVKSHLKSIYRKLGVRDRTGAVATALGHQLPPHSSVTPTH